MDWKFQIDYVCKNLSFRIASRIKNVLDISSRKLFYNAYNLPYSIFVAQYGKIAMKMGIKRLKIQKGAARIIFVAPILSPSINLFKKLKLLNFKYRISYHKLILVYNETLVSNY